MQKGLFGLLVGLGLGPLIHGILQSLFLVGLWSDNDEDDTDVLNSNNNNDDFNSSVGSVITDWISFIPSTSHLIVMLLVAVIFAGGILHCLTMIAAAAAGITVKMGKEHDDESTSSVYCWTMKGNLVIGSILSLLLSAFFSVSLGDDSTNHSNNNTPRNIMIPLLITSVPLLMVNIVLFWLIFVVLPEMYHLWCLPLFRSKLLVWQSSYYEHDHSPQEEEQEEEQQKQPTEPLLLVQTV